jgi:hypothetical protein
MPSEAINVPAAACQSQAIRGNQIKSEAIRFNQRQSTHQQHAKVRLHRAIREGDGDDEIARNEEHALEVGALCLPHDAVDHEHGEQQHYRLQQRGGAGRPVGGGVAATGAGGWWSQEPVGGGHRSRWGESHARESERHTHTHRERERERAERGRLCLLGLVKGSSRVRQGFVKGSSRVRQGFAAGAPRRDGSRERAAGREQSPNR